MLADHLSNFDSESGKDMLQWHAFVDKHFAPDARFIHSFAEDGTKPAKQYEVPRATIARYFQTYFMSSAVYLRLHLENGRENPLPPNRCQVSFFNATLTVAYANGTRLEMDGSVKVLFTTEYDNAIQLMELNTANVEECVARSELAKFLTSWSPTMANKNSPKMAKKQTPKAQQKMQSHFEGLTVDHFPTTPSKGTLGINRKVQAFLEVSTRETRSSF